MQRDLEDFFRTYCDDFLNKLQKSFPFVNMVGRFKFSADYEPGFEKLCYTIKDGGAFLAKYNPFAKKFVEISTLVYCFSIGNVAQLCRFQRREAEAEVAKTPINSRCLKVFDSSLSGTIEKIASELEQYRAVYVPPTIEYIV